MTTRATDEVMAARSLCKTFGATQALWDVSLGLVPGAVHALAGANGSGKSTLIKIMSGVFGPDSGHLLVDGAPQEWSSPMDSRAAGVGVVHQEAPLVDTLRVADCVALLGGFEGVPALGLSHRALVRRAQRLLDEHEVPVDARTTCAELGPADRAMVSLAVATGQGSRILILDEVTASLRQDDAEQVLGLVRRLADRGTAVLMVTHRIGEITQYADRLTVLAAGRTQYEGPSAEVSAARIIEYMLPEQRLAAEQAAGAGHRKEPAAPGSREAYGEGAPPVDGADRTLMEVRGLTGHRLDPLDLDIRAGEIVGVTGLPDSGVDELPYLLAGGVPPRSGTVRLRGFEPTRAWTASTARRQGVALLPRDRLSHGGVAVLSVADNIALPSLRRFWHRGSALREAIGRVIRELDVRPRDPSASLGSLSGGNQQKVLLGKWLSTDPKVLVLDEPTNGVDPGARLLMFEAVRKRVDQGMGAVLFSSEFEQLTAYCDRMVVLRPGAGAQEIPVPDNPVKLARIVASPQEDGPR
ncbi:sugar ABC transporter ATP-binding protein [Streptomyces sp. NPDC003300]|uniref:sugar ABC transporter ATP-binding protein n=1 Tax=unclassified Streptomyces TaxID=2593676 RepID=UPI0033AD91B7